VPADPPPAPRPRREAGEGGLEALPSGRWRAASRAGGARRSKTFATRREALGWLADLRARDRRGELAPPAAERETVGAYLARWLAGKRGTVAPQTWAVLEGNVALHLLPRLGRVRLAALTAEDVRALQGALLRAPGGTGRKVRGTLRQAVRQAVDDGLLARNVVDAARPPRPGRPVARTLRPREVVALWRAAAGHPLEALFRLASLVPTRSGELLRLRWDDLSAPRPDGTWTGRLTVRESKTGAGERTVDLDAGLLAVLRAHRKRQDADREAAGRRWAANGLVFCTALGAPLSRGNVLRSFRRLLRRAGVSDAYRLHDLRHTAVSALLADGVPLAEVAQLAGHANPGITARMYSHVLQRTRQPATGRLERFYEASGGPETPPEDG
jgi:integrase